jgi:hypothetical protein
LRRLSCFSISVALAQKMAGKSQKHAPDGSAVATADQACSGPAKREPDETFIPASFLER